MARCSLGDSFFILAALIMNIIVHTADSSSMEVYVKEDLCNQVIDMGTTQGNWKRVLFPTDEPCSSYFDCKLTFQMSRVKNYRETHVCVDFSRMRLYGDGATLHIGGKADQKVKLTTNQYPTLDKSMSAVFCISGHDQLVLQFNAECEKPLDGSFVSWMYVYLQGSDTGSIYFLDGSCSHLHQMGKQSHERKIPVRSYLWPRGPGDLSHQACSVRLLQSFFVDSARVAVQWNRSVDTVIPVGVMLKISKAYAGATMYTYHMAETYLTLRSGDVITKDLNAMYPISYATEVVLQVFRSLASKESAMHLASLLFELVASRVRIQVEKRKEDVEGEYTEYSDSSSGSLSSLKIVGICIGVVVLIALGFILYHYRSRFSTQGSSLVSHHGGYSVRQTNQQAESHSMLPTAPRLTPEEERGAVTMGDSIDVGTEGGPPSYGDLFPDCDGGDGGDGD